MLTERIVKAFTFKTDVYGEVENDANFTTTAWIIVAVAAFLGQLGSRGTEGFGRLIVAAVIGTAFAVAAFAAGAAIINFVGKSVFNAEVSFQELVRTLGLAYVWNAIGFLGIFGNFAPALRCIVGPIGLVAAIAGLIAWFVAAKEALDLEWVQTIVTVFLGWVVAMIILFLAGAFLSLIGFGAAAAGQPVFG